MKKLSYIKVPTPIFKKILKSYLYVISVYATEKSRYGKKLGVLFSSYISFKKLFLEFYRKKDFNSYENLLKFYDKKVFPFIPKEFQKKFEVFTSLEKKWKEEFVQKSFLAFSDLFDYLDREEKYYRKFVSLKNKSSEPLKFFTQKNFLISARIEINFPKENKYKGIFQDNFLELCLEKHSGYEAGGYFLKEKRISLNLPEEISLENIYRWVTLSLVSTLKHELVHYIQDSLLEKVQEDNPNQKAVGMPRKKRNDISQWDSEGDTDKNHALDDLEFYASVSDMIHKIRSHIKEKRDRILFVNNFDLFVNLNKKEILRNKKLYLLSGMFLRIKKYFQENDPWKFSKLQKILLKNI